MKPEYYRQKFQENFDKAGELIREAEARGEYNLRDLAVPTEIHQRHIDILDEIIADGVDISQDITVKIDGTAIKFKDIDSLAEALCSTT